jgi:hypothetical protein
MSSSLFAIIVTSNADFSRLSLCLIWITDFNPYHSINPVMSWVLGGWLFFLVFRRENTAVSLMNPFHKLSDFCFPVCVVSTLLVCLTTQTLCDSINLPLVQISFAHNTGAGESLAFPWHLVLKQKIKLRVSTLLLGKYVQDTKPTTVHYKYYNSRHTRLLPVSLF